MATTTTTYNLSYQVRFKGNNIISRSGLNIPSFTMNYDGVAKRTITPTNGTMTKLGTFSMAGKYCKANAMVYTNTLKTANTYVPNDIEVWASRTATTYYYWDRYSIVKTDSIANAQIGLAYQNGGYVFSINSWVNSNRHYIYARGTSRTYNTATTSDYFPEINTTTGKLAVGIKVNGDTNYYYGDKNSNWTRVESGSYEFLRLRIYYGRIKGGAKDAYCVSTMNNGWVTVNNTYDHLFHGTFTSISDTNSNGLLNVGQYVEQGWNHFAIKINANSTPTCYHSWITQVDTRGTKIDTVSSTNSTAYPTNGVSGSYWYTQA